MSLKNHSRHPPNKFWKIDLKPKLAWRAIIGLFLISFGAMIVGVAPIVSLIFPLGSFIVGILLYRQYPLLYVGFTWWLWFLSPLMKRLIDYRSGYGTFGSLTLAAGLVTLISVATLWKNLPEYMANSSLRDGLPFILCAGSIIFAFAIGLLVQSPLKARVAFLALMNWLSPICFGFHLFVNWRNYPTYRQNMQRIFFWGAAVMILYGVVQFFFVPSWETFHIDLFGEDFSLGWYGTPKPMQIRVWSTMQNPFDFSKILVSSLILLSVKKGPGNFILTGIGYLILIVTRVRTAWYTWFLSFLLFASSLRSEKQIRIIVSFVVVLIIVLPLILTSSFADNILERFETIINIGDDTSFQVRFFETANMLNHVLYNFLGVGLLSPSVVTVYGSDTVFHTVDNGYVTLFVSLGWLGIIPYLAGITLIFARVYQSLAARSDTFFVAARAIATATFISVLTTHISHGVGALNLWAFLGIAMAGHKYHAYERYSRQQIALNNNLHCQSHPQPST